MATRETTQQPRQQLQQPNGTTTTAINGMNAGMDHQWAQAYSAAMYNQQQKGGKVTSGLASPHSPFLNNPHLVTSLNNPAFATQLLMATSALQPQANGMSPDMAAVAAAGMMMGGPPLYSHSQQNPSSATRQKATAVKTGGQGAQTKSSTLNHANPTTTSNNNNNTNKDRKRMNSSDTTTTTTTTTTKTKTMTPISNQININNNAAAVAAPIATIHMNKTTPTLPSSTTTTDDRELKRQKRKQSNRESARRSRLRKQAETEELGNILDRYATENLKLKEAVEKLASERDIRVENERVLAKWIKDSGNKVPELKQVENPFSVSSLEVFTSTTTNNNNNHNDGVLTRSDTTTNSGGEGTNNSTDG